MHKITSTNKFVALALALICFNQTSAQTLKGKVLSENGKHPVPFAVVVINASNKGTTTDIDGNFSLQLSGGEEFVTIQVIGYETKRFFLKEIAFENIQIIKLKASDITLLEVTITPKENPAIPIIKKVIKNKPKYDIVNLPYYICNTYAKTYFTMADKNGKEDFYKKDTSVDKETKKLLDKTYLFFMESVTEKKYRYKNISQEKVLSSRVSGFKSAPFGAFASQLQSFTFYSDNIELLGVKYLSPLINGTFKRYKFEITDTVFSGTDTTILIKFSPKKNVKFKAMKGVLYINKNNHVLCNVLAEPATAEKGGTGIRVEQLYEKVDSIHWFPKQANTEILFNSINVSSGESGGAGTVMKGVSRLYIKEINIDTAFKIKNKSLAVYNAKDFDKKEEDFWNKHRVDSLNKKELKTYQVIDSVGKAANLDQKLKWFTALSTGKMQFGYFNLDLKHVLKFNEYEIARLGAGISTSNKLSRWFSVGGYGGYGFGDNAFKYGGHLKLFGNARQSTFLLGEIASDLAETAGTSFLNESSSLISTTEIRNLLISKMDKINYAKTSLNFSPINNLRASVFFKVEQRTSPFGYYKDLQNLSLSHINKFNLNSVGLQLKYWPGEKFIESLGQLISSGSKWPIFYLNVTKGLTEKISAYKGDFDYTKIDLMIDKQFNFKIKGFIALQLQAGKVLGNVPYSIQYNNKGSRADVLSISAEKTFETMYMNEFISSEYAAGFFTLNFGRIFKPRKKFNPEFEILHNYGIGNFNNPAQITLIELNDISKGFTEAGIRIKNILRSNISTFGVGVFYRYGNYAYEISEKNIAVKLVLGFSL